MERERERIGIEVRELLPFRKFLLSIEEGGGVKGAVVVEIRGLAKLAFPAILLDTETLIEMAFRCICPFM